MYSYPKQILNIQQQIQKYIDAGMSISSLDEATEALSTIGYFRLKGYCFHWYDNTTKKFLQGTTFSNLLLLYRFDMELSNLILQIISEIEITLPNVA